MEIAQHSFFFGKIQVLNVEQLTASVETREGVIENLKMMKTLDCCHSHLTPQRLSSFQMIMAVDQHLLPLLLGQSGTVSLCPKAIW